MPSAFAVYSASSSECCEEKRLGIAIPNTLFEPTAAQATHAATAESMPPDNPRTICFIPDFRQ